MSPRRELSIAEFLIVPRLISEYEYGTEERRSFEHFVRYTAPGLVSLDSAMFWNMTVLQACHKEPSLRHLLVAVSMLDEQRHRQSGTANYFESSHLRHYGKGLALLSRRIDPEIWLVLVASLVLCVFEDL